MILRTAVNVRVEKRGTNPPSQIPTTRQVPCPGLPPPRYSTVSCFYFYFSFCCLALPSNCGSSISASPSPLPLPSHTPPHFRTLKYLSAHTFAHLSESGMAWLVPLLPSLPLHSHSASSTLTLPHFFSRLGSVFAHVTAAILTTTVDHRDADGQGCTLSTPLTPLTPPPLYPPLFLPTYNLLTTRLHLLLLLLSTTTTTTRPHGTTDPRPYRQQGEEMQRCTLCKVHTYWAVTVLHRWVLGIVYTC
jgi:hypothetical protein